MMPSPLIPSEVRTPRLLLRRQQPDDAPLIKEAVDASIDHLKSSVAWARAAPFTLDTLAARLADSAASFDAGTEWVFTILDAVEHRVLGAVALEVGEPGLRALVGSEVFEVGYWLRADAIGRGYATEATAPLVELAFTRLGASQVAICHDPSNTASAGIPRRLGFRDLGTFTDERLPDRLAADGSVRKSTNVWALAAANARDDLIDDDTVHVDTE